MEDVNRTLNTLVGDYAALLEEYLQGGGETALRGAYELGRRALADGLGVLEMATAHRAAVGSVLTADSPPERVSRVFSFFAESLSPFEMVLRGFQETNERLRHSLRELSDAQEQLRLQHRELRMAHVAVGAEQQRYRQLFEFAPDGYLVTDLAGWIRQTNGAAARLLGVSQDRLVGRSLLEFVAAGERAEFVEQLRHFEQGNSVRKEDWQVSLQPPGQPAIHGALTADVESGEDRGVRWLLRDATERHRAEEERARSLVGHAEAEASRRFAFLADASALLAGSLEDETRLARVAQLAVPYLADWCFINVVDAAGVVVQCEITYIDPMQLDLAEKIRRQFLFGSSGPADPEPFAAAHIAQILNPITEAELELIAGRPGNKTLLQRLNILSAMLIPLMVHDRHLGSLTLLMTSSGRLYTPADLALAQDFGRRCALAVENARLYQEVIQERDVAAKASRAKDEFLAVLSHELRNPLMPVLGWARVLSGHSLIQQDPVLIEGVRSLDRNAQTLNRLVDDCLDLARISEGKVGMESAPVDLNRILTISVDSVRAAAEAKQLTVILELHPEPLRVLGDGTRLQQGAMNLLVNSVKYTPPGGSLWVRSYSHPAYAEFEVRDNGIGIRPEMLEQIFAPFHQGTGLSLTSESGLGLGLAIAHQIVELHRGQIWAESAGPGTGSVFRVRLPLTSMSAPISSLASGAPAPPSRRDSLRVLLVDDSADVLFLMKVEMERLGFSVLQASDCVSAVELARRERPDAIISDVKMPDLDGYEFIRRIRATPETCGILAFALTGFGRKGDIERAMAAGFDSCFAKPADPDELAAALRQMAGERKQRSALASGEPGR
jgi:PAS domain S-box-containing protein